MKRFALSAAVIGIVVFGSSASNLRADEFSSASTRVFVTVNPNVGVDADLAVWDLGTVQTGDFSAVITWRVDANSQFLDLALEASNLYKGDDPLNDEVAPIPLNLSDEAEVDPANGNESNSGDNLLDWTGGTGEIDSYPTFLTEFGNFESSQNGHFSQSVVTTIYYSQDDPEKPQGQYSGVVRLLAMIPGSAD
jgi:hypothetical protein